MIRWEQALLIQARGNCRSQTRRGLARPRQNPNIRDLFNQSHHGETGSQPKALAAAVVAYERNIDRLFLARASRRPLRKPAQAVLPALLCGAEYLPCRPEPPQRLGGVRREPPLICGALLWIGAEYREPTHSMSPCSAHDHGG